MKIVFIVLAVVAALAVLAWVGLRIQPKPFPAHRMPGGAVETVPLPEGLPKPVDRYYRLIYGDRIPVITSAVVTGRASLRPFGPVALPARYRFTHEAGKNYRHYIEATLFGIPVMRVNERYIDGQGFMDLGFATDEGPKINQGAALGLWAESAWFPAIYLTDDRVRWEAIDDDTASLVVPFDEGSERFVVRFDPQTGLVDWMESMRYHASDSAAKVLWMNKSEAWTERDGRPFPLRGSATWMDDGKPWAVFTLEDIVFNADVSEYLRARGL
ncbi:MAG: hypothetical protein MUC34_13945 [Anaerolineae bacterium]|jgi:hypothetical protein|nr:hypothetical protein [Anaerolineae bacterium]